MKIKNVHYRQFLDNGIITLLTEDQIDISLSNVTGRNKLEGRALLIALYYTGARPNEILSLYGKDVKQEGSFIVIQIPSSKGGLPRPVYLQYKKDKVKELYKFALGVFPDLYLFPNFRNSYTRTKINKKGVIKENTEITDKLRYYFKKWFKNIEGGISPYFLRHNRFSSLISKGATQEDIRFLKGGKTLTSVTPYLHLSAASSKKLAKKIN